MVSSAVNMSVEELVAALTRFKDQYANDPDWQERRKAFPDDWPF